MNVIYSLGGGHTNTHRYTDVTDKTIMKPGEGWHALGLKMKNKYYNNASKRVEVSEFVVYRRCSDSQGSSSR